MIMVGEWEESEGQFSAKQEAKTGENFLKSFQLNNFSHLKLLHTTPAVYLLEFGYLSSRTDETEEDAQKRLSQWSEHLANTENADSDDEPGAAVTAAAAPAITVAEPFQADNQPEAIRNE